MEKLDDEQLRRAIDNAEAERKRAYQTWLELMAEATRRTAEKLKSPTPAK